MVGYKQQIVINQARNQGSIGFSEIATLYGETFGRQGGYIQTRKTIAILTGLGFIEEIKGTMPSRFRYVKGG